MDKTEEKNQKKSFHRQLQLMLATRLPRELKLTTRPEDKVNQFEILI